MRTSVRCIALAGLMAGIATACQSAPAPLPPPVMLPLADSAAAALIWAKGHAVGVSLDDSIPSGGETALLATFATGASVIGVSELTEGTREFAMGVRHVLFALADSGGARGLAIQAPMAEAMEIDRFVRTGEGNPKRLLHALGSWRWETPEMLSLVSAIREWNRAHAPTKQIGFYGFEIPSAAHAVDVVSSLPDSIAGAPLKAWLRREYGCVLTDEAARFGREGRMADSLFWRRCGVVANATVDSIVALRARSNPSRSARLERVEQMARLVQHHVGVGLRYLSRQDANAEHVLYVARLLGPGATLIAWGGDVEMGRLTLDKTTVQTGQSLADKLGQRYRALAFMIGDGTVRARPGTFNRSGQPADFTSVAVRPPLPMMYEDVLSRVPLAAYWIDLRALPADIAGGWLKGPRPARLITEVYAAGSSEAFQTPVEIPGFFDGLLFVRHVNATR